jgi:uncharacterized protein YkwD
MRCVFLVIAVVVGCAGTAPSNRPPPNDDDDGDGAGAPNESSDAEVAMLARINQLRSEGVACPDGGTFAATTPLVMHPILRDVARAHSVDMATQNYFDHNSLDGTSPFARMGNAGYAGSTMGENIAAGSADVESTFQQWFVSPDHCANMMSAAFTETGIGFASGGEYGAYWTETFGAP